MVKSLVFSLLLLTGCSTGIGRAVSYAVMGTPSEVKESIVFVNKETKKMLLEHYQAVESADVTRNGVVVQEWAEARFREMESTNARIERWDQLSKALADYNGVEINDDLTSSEKEADERRKRFWKAIIGAAKETINDR